MACLYSPLATSGRLTLQFEKAPFRNVAEGVPSCPFCGTSGARDDWNREWRGVDPAKLRGGYILKDGETFEGDVLPIRCRAKYQQHIETIRKVAREHGYAIGVHGSIRRDIDLIAAPWTEEASDGETLAEAIADAVDGVIDMGSVPGRWRSDDHLKPEAKPHGRLCWTIHLGGGPYIDLSVMPQDRACESPLHWFQVDVPADGDERCACGKETLRPSPKRQERQRAISDWCAQVFGADHALSVAHRAVRMLEEAIEAYQAAGAPADMAYRLVEHVFARPVGDLSKEIGAVGVTVLALAQAAGIDADEAERMEIARVMAKPLEHFAARNKAKNDAGFDATNNPHRGGIGF